MSEMGGARFGFLPAAPARPWSSGKLLIAASKTERKGQRDCARRPGVENCRQPAVHRKSSYVLVSLGVGLSTSRLLWTGTRTRCPSMLGPNPKPRSNQTTVIALILAVWATRRQVCQILFKLLCALVRHLGSAGLFWEPAFRSPPKIGLRAGTDPPLDSGSLQGQGGREKKRHGACNEVWWCPCPTNLRPPYQRLKRETRQHPTHAN